MSEMLNMGQAQRELRVNKAEVLKLALGGKINGAVRGEGRTGRWQLPRAELERLLSEGALKAKKTREQYLGRGSQTGASDRISIAEAAERFGLGRSTVEKYVASGKLPAVKAQLGPGHKKTFVSVADMTALRAQIPVTKRGRHPKTGVVKKLVATGKVSLTPTAPTSLDAELLRAADLVRAGSYHVSKLNIALEFTGGGNE